MSPAEFAARALHTNVRSVVDVEQIKHGLTNESWLVCVARSNAIDSVVVRISNVADDSLQIDRLSEARILEVVDAAGIGAPVLFCDPTQRVLVTRYLGATWTDVDTRTAQNISTLGAAFRRLHAVEMPAQIRRVILNDVVNDYVRTLQNHGLQSDQPLVTNALEVATMLDQSVHRRLCHNDVHNLNIVDSDGLRFIDWEYAGLGAPAFDLASVCVYHRYDSLQRAQLLDAYAQPHVVTAVLLDDACGLFDYIRNLWTQVRELT